MGSRKKQLGWVNNVPLLGTIVLMWSGRGQAGSTTWPIATTTATTTTTTACSAIEACRHDSACGVCLTAIEAWQLSEGVIPPQIAQREREFFRELYRTPECNDSATQILAMLEVIGATQIDTPMNAKACGLDFSPCQLNELQCFLNETWCGRCLQSLHAFPSDTARLLTTAPCTSVNRTVLSTLSYNCFSFPTCTYQKQLCTQQGTRCLQCWRQLRLGNPVRAATECASGTDAQILNNLVYTCTSNTALEHTFYRKRCEQNSTCFRCLQAMGSGMSINTIVEGSISADCIAARQGYPTVVAADSEITFYLVNIFFYAPPTIVPRCNLAVAICVLSNSHCAECVLSSVPNATYCNRMREQYSFSAACQTCPAVVAEINAVVLATSIVGAVSVGGCIAVLAVIFAYSKDRDSMSQRIIIGLMVANGVYSIANAIPMNQLQTGLLDCGQFVLSFETIRFGRAFWFWGKWSLVSFEISILGLSLWALSRGATSLPAAWELAAHVLCVLCGAAAFAYFYYERTAINNAGYNTGTQSQSLSNTYDHFSEEDDLDDDNPQHVAALRFLSARNAYDALVQSMLQAWVGALGAAIAMWLGCRWMFLKVLSAWRVRAHATEQQWHRDNWDRTDGPDRRVMLRTLSLAKEAYEQVAKPLEPFVITFVVFGSAAVVMSTSYCVDNSNAAATTTSERLAGPHISYGTCDVYCELVLSFRSLATVAVYFATRETRAELFAGRTLCRRLWNRVVGCPYTRRRGRVKFHKDGLEQIRMIPHAGTDTADTRTPEQDTSTLPYTEWSDSDAPLS